MKPNGRTVKSSEMTIFARIVFKRVIEGVRRLR